MTEWISVKDRLPKGDGYCLVWYTESNSVEIAWFDYGTRFCKGVTHWQPLPDAPKPSGPFYIEVAGCELSGYNVQCKENIFYSAFRHPLWFLRENPLWFEREKDAQKAAEWLNYLWLFKLAEVDS